MEKLNAIEAAFLKLRSRLAKSVSRIVPAKEIEDIVQETYIRIRQTDNLERIRDPESFLYRTARNLALDHVKRAESRLVDGEDDMDQFARALGSGEIDETFRSVASDEEFAHFCEAVRKLPPQSRRAFVLRKVYGFSQKEIAGVMSISESAVEKHIASGLRSTYVAMQKKAEVRGGRSNVTRLPIKRNSGDSR